MYSAGKALLNFMKILKLLSYLLVTLLIVYVSAAWYFSTTVLHLNINECNQEHYVFCGGPGEQGIEFEDVEFVSKDGLTLSGWYMPAGMSTKTILLVHGRGASRHEGMRYAKPLIQAGYNVFAIDMRHPRQAEGVISTMGYYERYDVIGALDYIESRTPSNKIGIMGFSMGASISIKVMANDARLKTGVFNSGFANATDVLAENAAAMYGMPRYPLMPAVMALVEWRSGIDASDINPETYIAKISPRPILIMHGTSDQTVGYSHGERLFEAALEPKQFWSVDGGEHTRLWQHDQSLAESKVVTFFNETL